MIKLFIENNPKFKKTKRSVPNVSYLPYIIMFILCFVGSRRTLIPIGRFWEIISKNIMQYQRISFSYICIVFWLLCNDNRIERCRCEIGGQDLFASLSQLEGLWHNEIQVVNLMEKIIKTPNSSLNSLKS